MKTMTGNAWRVVAFGMLGMIPLVVAAAQQVRVTGQNVNFRAGPGPQFEVVAQALKGDILTVGAEGVGTNWACVLTPEKVDVWVHGTLVSDGVVTAPRAQVRGGPGINYRALGRLDRGDKVVVRGQWQEWLKIAPPPGTQVWISTTYVESLVASGAAVDPVVVSTVLPSTNVPPAVRTPSGMDEQGFPPKPASDRLEAPPLAKPRMAAGSSSIPGGPSEPVSGPVVPTRPIPVTADSKASVPRELAGRALVPDVVQGRQVVYSGVLRSSGFIWQKTGEYRLVGQDDKGRSITLCYLIGRESEMGQQVGKKVQITGQEYWVQGVRFSVVRVTGPVDGE